MLKEILLEIYERDLANLKKEINLYSDESKLWVLKDGITNSAGNLTLHLIGNLNHFFGATLDNNGFVRDRDREFTLKNVACEDLNARIDEALAVVKQTLNNLSEADFAKDYPLSFQERTVKTDFFLVHLATHLTYHLGQINYHRCLIS
jgi:uncharacterized damage-inducible protein DinB